jgi:hypothetical protein
MVFQTSIQNATALKFGSAKVEAGADVGSLIDIGVSDGLEFSESFTPLVIKPGNAQEIRVGNIQHFATVKFELWEFKLSNVMMLRGGMDTAGSVAGSSTPVVDELHVLTGVTAVRLNHKNGDNSVVTSISVKDSADGAAVQNTDYVISVDSAGWPCIARVAASTVITTGEQVKVSYTYVPYAAAKMTTGGLITVSPKVVRLTNTNAAGKVFRITIYSATNQKGIELKFPADESADNMKPVFELKGVTDVTRTAGDQLFEIYDEQSA